jgi:hypothetical protein
LAENRVGVSKRRVIVRLLVDEMAAAVPDLFRDVG